MADGARTALVWALLRVPALWPMPGLLLLALTLPFLPQEAWQPQFTTHRVLSKAEFVLVCSCVSAFLYWLVLLLGRLGLLHTTRSWGMREPSNAEQALAAAALRWLCLLGVYVGPIALLAGC
jgi:hypothetical protein